MAVKVITIWGLTAIAVSLIAGVLAGIKNRDVSYWMGWCFILPPMLVALLMIPKLAEPRIRGRHTHDDDDSSDR